MIKILESLRNSNLIIMINHDAILARGSNLQNSDWLNFQYFVETLSKDVFMIDYQLNNSSPFKPDDAQILT